MKILLYLTVISSSYGCFSKWFGKKDNEEKPISRDAFIPQTETTKKVPVPPTARQRNPNRNRGPVDIGTYRDQSDNRFMSQDVNNYTQSKQPQELVVKTPGPVCRGDSNSDLKHKCRSSMKRGDVCRDKVTGCDGCKKNEYIEVVVRCSQAPQSSRSSIRYTMLKKCKGMSIRDDAIGLGGSHVCWQI